MATRIGNGLIAAIIKAHFAATPEQVEQLAHNVVEGQHAAGTYLQVVLAHMQAKLGRPRRGKQPPQEPVLDAVHEMLYPAVLKGVGPDDLSQVERFRRATFARSAASTVRYFVRNGGDVRGLDVAKVTKNGLRKSVQPETPPPEEETRAERSLRKAVDAIARSAQRLARSDPGAARERIEAAMDELDKLLESIPAEPQAANVGATTTIATGRPGVGRGAPAGAMLHRPAG